MAKVNSIIVSRNDIDPNTQICVNQQDVNAEPPTNVITDVDYAVLTPDDKILFDQTVAMILTYLPV